MIIRQGITEQGEIPDYVVRHAGAHRHRREHPHPVPEQYTRRRAGEMLYPLL